MGCIPYYMPRRVDDLRYCKGEEATEFVKILSNTTIMDRLGEVCPQSCGQVEFEYFATSENIDADEACAKAMLPGRTSLRVSLYLRVTD